MTTKETVAASLVHLAIPLTGLICYLRIIMQMKREKIEKAPIISLFFIFATYGCLLFVLLTTLFWHWSDMSSLGTFYLILGSPIIMGLIAYRYQKKKETSRYHNWTFIYSACYFIIAPFLFFLLTLKNMSL